MNYASTQIPTAEASQYIHKLCRHFAHKVPVTFTEQEGQVQFLQGQCLLQANAQSLAIYMQAEAPEGIPAMQFIIDDHLRRFARFETLSYQWGTEVPMAVKTELAALTQARSAP